MGMTYWGVTTLKFVTGTHTLAQKYINPKAKRAFTGDGSKEYRLGKPLQVVALRTKVC